jgi:hypothetical protein
MGCPNRKPVLHTAAGSLTTIFPGHRMSDKVFDSVYNRCSFKSNPNVDSRHHQPARAFEDDYTEMDIVAYFGQ